MLFSQGRKKEWKEPDGNSLSPFFSFSEMLVWKTSVINFQRKLKQASKETNNNKNTTEKTEKLKRHFTTQGEKRW